MNTRSISRTLVGSAAAIVAAFPTSFVLVADPTMVFPALLTLSAAIGSPILLSRSPAVELGAKEAALYGSLSSIAYVVLFRIGWLVGSVLVVEPLSLARVRSRAR